MVQITDDSGPTLVDPLSGVAFHSASGSIAETRHVYLQNSGVQRRIEQRKPTRVFEIGLGTGLGLLLTTDQAVQHRAPLTYVALEKDWLPTRVLKSLELHEHLVNRQLAETYLAWRAGLPERLSVGVFAQRFGTDQRAIVHHGDALQWSTDDPLPFDAIYFDPFAPSENPELWTAEMFAKLYPLLRSGGKLTTYCVNSKVRRTIASVGFHVQTVNGPPGGKREVLVASK